MLQDAFTLQIMWDIVSQLVFTEDVTSVHGKVAPGLVAKVKLFPCGGTGEESADSNGSSVADALP